MRVRIPWWVVVGFVVALSGCQPADAPATRIVGSWEVDRSTTAGALAQKANIRLDITAAGQISIASTLPIVGEVKKSGTWKFLSAEGTRTRIEIRLEGVERGSPLDIEVLGPDLIELLPPNTPISTKVRFRRAMQGAP